MLGARSVQVVIDAVELLLDFEVVGTGAEPASIEVGAPRWL
jgi:hypothetical protein